MSVRRGRLTWILGCLCAFPLKFDLPDDPTCLVLDVGLPGESGLDPQRELATANRFVFITGHGDIPMSVQAMKGGAIEFPTKPFGAQDPLDAIRLGLTRDRVRRENDKALTALRACFASLSPGSGEIMIEVAQGRLKNRLPAIPESPKPRRRSTTAGRCKK